ncbi:HalOD1 output domain-containing protein [Halorubrum salsamenti]|uniref:HalOD1 output domain-containing protein n=1 Tax=Halorubrum salsamenti TaxID=2583990 RepID=UPI001F4FB75D
MAVMEAVAAATGRNTMEMPSLYDTLDVEALDGLLTSERAAANGNVAVSFTYDGAYVWIDSSGAIEIDPNAARSE